MGFRTRPEVKRQIILTSLTDMFFILLMFYLVVQSGGAQSASIKTQIKVPMSATGKVNVLLQLMRPNQYLWLDTSAIGEFQTGVRPADFERRHTFNFDDLSSAIGQFKKLHAHDNTECYHVMIRCSNALDYRDVQQVMDLLVGKTGSDVSKGDLDAVFAAKLQLSVIGYNGRGNIDYQSGKDGDGEYLQISFGE